ADQRRPGHAAAHPSEVDRELRREWPRRELGEREPFDVVALGYPATLLDEVTLHVAHQCDGPTEARRAQAKEVEEQLTQRAGGEAFVCRLIDRELDRGGGGHDGSHALPAEILVQVVEHR